MATSMIPANILRVNATNIRHLTGSGQNLTISAPYGNYAPVLIFGIIAQKEAVVMVFPLSATIDYIFNPQSIALTKTSGSTYVVSTPNSGGWDAYIIGGFGTATLS